mgnify:CR=1 FL=1
MVVQPGRLRLPALYLITICAVACAVGGPAIAQGQLTLYCSAQEDGAVPCAAAFPRRRPASGSH